jgi:hypothetical protein
MRYPPGTRLCHHAGSVWEVVGQQVNGDYWIRCVLGSRRPGFIGGEDAGRETAVHPDYLHGDGWTFSRPLPRSAAGQETGK